jgi:hypothetical protein
MLPKVCIIQHWQRQNARYFTKRKSEYTEWLSERQQRWSHSTTLLMIQYGLRNKYRGILTSFFLKNLCVIIQQDRNKSISFWILLKTSKPDVLTMAFAYDLPPTREPIFYQNQERLSRIVNDPVRLSGSSLQVKASSWRLGTGSYQKNHSVVKTTRISWKGNFSW